jgi:carbonic anhydrase
MVLTGALEKLMRFFSSAAVVLALAAVATAQNAPWSYAGRTGPANWGKLDPAYRTCATGQQQSPIDIRHPILNKALKPLQFSFLGGPVTLVNNGHTVVAHVVPGSYMVADGVRYNLLQFDFHDPSEGAINGVSSDMDVQFLLKSADGKLAGVVVHLTSAQDFPNATLSTLWGHLPTTVGATEEVTDMVNPGGLLPSSGGYWTYMGSLTQPPCTEGVRWFVFQRNLSISRAQLNAFDHIFLRNARPLQDLHGRRVEANE